MPITLVARQPSWSRGETARAAHQASTSHVITTLIVGVVVWVADVEFVTWFGTIVREIAGAALVLSGEWIA